MEPIHRRQRLDQTRHTKFKLHTYMHIESYITLYMGKYIPAYLIQFHDLASVFFFFLIFALFSRFPKRRVRHRTQPKNEPDPAQSLWHFSFRIIWNTRLAHTQPIPSSLQLLLRNRSRKAKKTTTTKKEWLWALWFAGNIAGLLNLAGTDRCIHIKHMRFYTIRDEEIFIYWVSFCLTQMQILDIVFGFCSKHYFGTRIVVYGQWSMTYKCCPFR